MAMTDDNLRRDDPEGDAAANGPAPSSGAPDSGPETAPESEPASGGDAFLDAIRDIPRLSSDEDPVRGRAAGSAAPALTRLGAVAQGCGSGLLTALALPMLLVSMGAGFYTWGPVMLAGFSLLLAFSTSGMWAGKRTTLVISLSILSGIVFLLYTWWSFIPAAGWMLTPLGDFRILYIRFAPQLVVFAILVLGVTHLGSLFYWARLQALSRRGLVVWGILVVGVIVFAVLFHVRQQAQREDWLTDQRDEWRAGALTDGRVVLGSNVNITLGNSFLNMEDEDDPRFDERMAELFAVQESGARVIRLTTASDVWLETENPLLFDDDEISDEQLALQRVFQADYLDALGAQPGTHIVLSDSAHSPYLIIQANDDGEMSWREFTELHRDRVQTYAAMFNANPDYANLELYAYEVISSPSAYAVESGVDEPEDDDARLRAWVIHTNDLVEIVRAENNQVLVGVSIEIGNDFDLDYYEALLDPASIGEGELALDYDFISFRIYQPQGIDLMEELFEEYGDPADYGKQVWITETWYGACLAEQRSMSLDSLWLEAVVAYADQNSTVTAVLPNDSGCYLQEGGTLFSSDIDLDGRTGVWETWQTLVAGYPVPTLTELSGREPLPNLLEQLEELSVPEPPPSPEA
ncbi:MAG: hypothetical protein GYB65_07090 [Chloroflexi bacterium]|nr:hypothetical protein [Chloroflexota bacterium]